MSDLELVAPELAGEVTPGTDLVGLLLGLVRPDDGDVLVVTSKVVSKAEGRLVPGDRDGALAGETVRVVARRGPTAIVENRLGLVMAAAGIDASNVPAGTVALLPEDPDASAARLREGLHAATGRNVAVVVSDTAGRAWRTGQTDLAIGLAGLSPAESYAGRTDPHGNPLVVTEPAFADEVAGAAELASGKLGGRPVVLVRGLAARVLPAGEHGPGARALQRPRAQDMFALGSREAVVAAAAGEQPDAFGAPADVAELHAALTRCGVAVGQDDGSALRLPDDPALAERGRMVAHAHGWTADGQLLVPPAGRPADRLPGRPPRRT